MPMRIWLGEASNWLSFSSQTRPSLLGIGKGDRLDHHTFIRPTNTACTGLASNINPAHACERGFLRGGNRWSCPHRTPASPWFHSPCACHPVLLITILSEKPDQPGRASAHAG
ncbi:MAG: hypothetical protein ACJ8BW_36540 [Ktedonobacteraceae bacterium]